MLFCMVTQLRNYFIPRPFLLLASACALVLGGAYLSQYGFGLHPCHLCLLQRYPYMAVIGLAVLGHLLHRRQPKLAIGLMLLISLTLLGEAGLAGYHAGVEWKLFPGPSGCTVSGSLGGSAEDILAAIKNAPLVSCSEPAFTFLGLSMAGWNMLAALAIFGVSLKMLRRNICAQREKSA